MRERVYMVAGFINFNKLTLKIFSFFYSLLLTMKQGKENYKKRDLLKFRFKDGRKGKETRLVS